MDDNGNELKKIGKHDSQDGEFRSPMGILVDKNDKLELYFRLASTYSADFISAWCSAFHA